MRPPFLPRAAPDPAGGMAAEVAAHRAPRLAPARRPWPRRPIGESGRTWNGPLDAALAHQAENLRTPGPAMVVDPKAPPPDRRFSTAGVRPPAGQYPRKPSREDYWTDMDEYVKQQRRNAKRVDPIIRDFAHEARSVRTRLD